MKLAAELFMNSEYEELKEYINKEEKEFDDLCNMINDNYQSFSMGSGKREFEIADKKSDVIFLNLLWLYGNMAPELMLFKNENNISHRYFKNEVNFFDHKDDIDSEEKYVYVYKPGVNLLNIKYEADYEECNSMLAICQRGTTLDDIQKYLDQCRIVDIGEYLYYATNRDEKKHDIESDSFLIQRKAEIEKNVIVSLPLKITRTFEENQLKKMRKKFKTYELFSSMSTITVKERICLFFRLEDILKKIMDIFTLYDDMDEESDKVLSAVLKELNHPFCTDLILIKNDVEVAADMIHKDMMDLISIRNKEQVQHQRYSNNKDTMYEIVIESAKCLNTLNTYQGDLRFIFDLMKEAYKGDVSVILCSKSALNYFLECAYRVLDNADIKWTKSKKNGAICYILMLIEYIETLDNIEKGKPKSVEKFNKDKLAKKLLGYKEKPFLGIQEKVRKNNKMNEKYINKFIKDHYDNCENNCVFGNQEKSFTNNLNSFCKEMKRCQIKGGFINE